MPTQDARPNVKSRSPKARHERAAIRRFLRAAMYFHFLHSEGVVGDELEESFTDVRRASSSLANVYGYEKAGYDLPEEK